MPFNFSRLAIPDVILIKPRIFSDERGQFLETYKQSEFEGFGISGPFAQGNHSISGRGVLRGLHYQAKPKAQAKLVRVVVGEIFDVAVDIRKNSPTYGQWVAANLSAVNRAILYIPVGFAHGFCVLSESAEVLYMASEEYSPSHERGIIWNDPKLSIDWPIDAPILSAKDKAWPTLREVLGLGG
jgi:dTDP-4-dehydrorhamnose 3,5-epimerase